MANKPQNKTPIEKLLEKFSSIWGIIITATLLIATGFGVGTKYENNEFNTKLRELENQKQIQNIEFGEKVFELQKEIFELQKEIIDLKVENNRINNYKNENKK